MTHPRPLPTVPAHVDSDGRLATSLACLNCGYDLRGLELDETCPECGLAIRTTLRQDRLAEAPAAWLRQLQRGARIARVGTALTLPVLGLPVAMLGLWMLTTPQPGRQEPAADERFRWAGRTLALGGTAVLVGLVAWLAWLAVTRPRELLTSADRNIDVIAIAGGGLFVLGFLCITVHLASLAQRVPDEALWTRIRSTQRYWLAGLGTLMAIALAAQVVNRLYLADVLTYRPWGAAVFFAAVAVVLLWLWVVTLRMLGAVGRAIAAVAGLEAPRRRGG